MSDILNDLIEQAKQQVDDYEDYLKQLVELAKKVESPNLDSSYPNNINTPALAAIFDNTGTDEELALTIHKAILNSKKDGWKGHKIKEKIIRNAIKKIISDNPELVDKVIGIAREQSEY
jgi:type I restriction enzyme R subunit